MNAKPLLAAVSLLSLAAPLPALTQAPAGRDAEAAFDRQIDPAEQTAWLKRMSSAPNHVGSPHDKENAEFILAQFKSFGWDARIETFSVLYPTPISTTVELVQPERIVLGGQEPAIPEDETSGSAGMLPPYVAYQGDGDVTADLVYANYGMPEDYEALARRGIDVRGKIVIARYGGGWRGLKPKLAQDHGAAGCIIYSDPADDGYAQGDSYPRGGTRPPGGVQRGSVQDMAISPGDPLTPGVGATAGAKRQFTRATAPTILKIPALPMSYGDATRLLQRLGGPIAPGNWRGALPLTYHIGGDGKTQVHLAVKSDWAMKPLYDVIAMLKGAKAPDEWVVRGNHHDGWVFGASDPLSGNIAMMAEAKALGGLWRQGWRPDRTIVYASWDGEEPGLLGSTEWSEQHGDELRRKAVIYVNTDGNGRGFFNAQGSHPFQHLVNGAVADVTDPQTKVSVLDRRRAQIRADAYDHLGRVDDMLLAAAEKGQDLPIGPLGSGSDYSGFLQHLGIPSLNMGYGGEDENDGAYHSIYDSFHHFTTFDDPGLAYAATLSKTVGRIVLRMADASTTQQRYGDFAETVGRYLVEVKKLEADRRAEDEKRRALTEADLFRLRSDPLHPVGAPTPEAATPHVEMAALEDAVDRLKTSAAAFDKARAAAGALSPARQAQLNGRLRDVDQLLMDDRGLPGRPWFKNLVYAPGRFTGYGAKTLPGVREAIEERRFADANDYAGRTARVLIAYADRLDAARAIVEGR